MATDDTSIISRIQGDNALAQRVRCGGCSVPMAQNGGPISEANLVPVKNKKLANTDKQAVGFLCNTCLNDKARKEEGPRTAVFISPTTDAVGEIFYDNLVDSTSTVSLEGSEVSRSDTTGKLTAAGKKGEK
jgi:hypothetical protein